MLAYWLHKIKFTLYLVIGSWVLFYLLNIFFPFSPQLQWSSLLHDSKGEILFASLNEDDKWRMYTTLDEISPELRKAIVFKEDRHFYKHPGVNPLAIIRALAGNAIKGQRNSGASTIPMQIARLLEPRPRTYRSKLIEMFRALQLDMQYSKRELLQMYLNLAPYGGNIEGVKAASLLYLGKSPAQLNLADITALAIIPNRPNSLRPGIHNDLIQAERNKWLNRFEKAKLFPSSLLADARSEPFNAYRRDAPKEAPHLARRLGRELQDNQTSAASNSLRYCTLDAKLQRKSENLITNRMRSLRQSGIHNAAVMVIENETAQVKVYVGSADFYSGVDGSQVDGIQAVRSPGSTLKPFLFGLSIDSGLITPASATYDVPVNYGGYRPRNYDLKYRGKVSASEALAQSLNVPAVNLLHDYGVQPFVSALSKAGIERLKARRDKLGLSLILGGCGITLEELCSLYASFAYQGVYRKPVYESIQPNSETGEQSQLQTQTRLMSPGANWIVTNVLSELKRPDLPTQFEFSKNLPRIAWKTGTSFGRRDAWAIGFNKQYTIAVWTGNFSGKGVADLNGAAMAAPLLFELFETLDRKSGKQWFEYAGELEQRWVCEQTGLPPNGFCEYLIMDDFVPLVSSNRLCDHRRSYLVNADSSSSYCTDCQPAQGTHRALFDNPPPELARWNQKNDVAYLSVPPHNPDCSRVHNAALAQSAPKIISPTDGMTYLTTSGGGQIELACQASDDVDTILWYVNDLFYKRQAAGIPVFLETMPGDVKISCIDDKGRNTNVRIVVERL